MFNLTAFFQKLSLKKKLPAQLDIPASTETTAGVKVPPTPPIAPLAKQPFLTAANLRLLLVSSVLLIVGGAGWLTWQQGWLTKVKPIPASAQVTLTADDQASDGVNPTTTFTLQSDEPLSPASVKANFKSEPAVDFKISRITPTSLALTSTQPLAKETVYKFALATDAESNETLATWAFQTQGEFRITQTLPRDKATSVSTKTSIELTFSHEKFADPVNFVSFDPPLEGRWERHYQTAVFIPKQIDPGKIYTVKVDQKLGLDGTDKTLAKDRIFRFETSQDINNDFWLSTNRELLEFGPDEIPAMTANLSRSESDLQVKVFAYNSGEEFAQAWAAKQALPNWSITVRSNYQVPTQNLRQVAAFTASLQKDSGYQAYFNFPEALPVGWYLTQVTAVQDQQSKTVYAWIQISSLAAYVNLSQTDSLVWAMDRSNSQPAAQAKVKLWPKSELGETNNAGVAIFKTPSELLTTQKLVLDSTELDQDKPAQLMLVQAGDKSLYIPSFTYQPSGYASHWGWYDSGAAATTQFWQYLNFDKPMYKPGDTVQFWGMIRDRDDQKIPVDALTVKVMTGYGQDRAQVAIGTVVKLADDGTFMGQIVLPQVKPGSYALVLSQDDSIYFNQYIEVQTYVKPAYTLDLNLNKRAIFAGESFKAKGQAAFFEGTPLPKLPVKINANNADNDVVEVTTNATGEFAAEMMAKAPSSAYTGSQPQSQYLSVTPKRAEEGEISASDSLLVFPSKYLLTSRQNIKDNQATIDFKVNAVDLSTIKSQYPSREEYTGKPIGGVSLPISVVRVKYDKVETGETYNPILKTVEKNYRYDRKEEPVKDDAVTTNEQGQAVFAIPIAPDEQLVATVTLTDQENRRTQEKVYLFGHSSDIANNNQLNLLTAKELTADPEKRNDVVYGAGEAISLLVKKGESDAPVNDQTRYLLRLSQRGLRSVIANSKPEFNYTFTAQDAPDLVAVAVQFDGKRFSDTSSKLLNFDTNSKKLVINVTPNQAKFVPGDKVIMNVAVTDKDGRPQKTTLNLNVLDKALLALRGTSDDVLSNLYAKVPSGVFFTYISHQDPRSPMAEGGGGCFLTGTPILMADHSTKPIEKVAVGDEILTKKDIHDPTLVASQVTRTVSHQVGEYLIINDWLKVTPEHILWVNGAWQVAGNLRVGDSLLDARGELAAVSSIVREYGNVTVYNLTTASQHTFFAGGFYVHNEKGDRSEFKDVAFFQNVTTDNQGQAKVEFKLPDNLTAWRVLAEGVGEDNPPQAGSAVKEITVSQSAYVMVNLAEEYLAGDQPILQLKAFGDDLKENQAVEFFVEGKTIGIEGRKIYQGQAFVPTKIELPSLPAGTHDLIVGMKAGGFEDKLTRQISVKTSRLTRPASLVLPVKVDQTIDWPEVKDGLIKIIFSNPMLNQVRSTAHDLQFSWNDRLDSKLARNLAQNWLAQDSGQSWPAEQTNLDLTLYQAKGGMNLLPHSDTDLYYSMLTALVAPSQVDRAELIAYFQQILRDQKQGRLAQIQAIAGLAGLQQPALLSLKQLVATNDLSTQERIYAAAGAAALGDQVLAGQLLQPVIDQAQTADENLIVKDAPNPDQQQQLTWLAAAVANGIKHPQAIKLVNGANSLYTKETLTNLERYFFIKQASLANLTKESTLIVKVGDELLTQTLNAKNSKLAVMVSADQLATVQVKNVQGDVSALLTADIPINTNSATDPDFKIQRQYQVDGQVTNQAQEGQLVEINLPYSISTAKQLNGCVQITDWLPAGLRVITTPRLYGEAEETVSYPYEVDKQKVSFCAGSEKNKLDSVIRYYARIINVGAFKTDPALIQPMQLPGNYGLSQPSALIITVHE